MILTELDNFIWVRHEEIERRLSHEVVEEIMDSFGYIRPVLFAKLLKFKWLDYVSQQ